MTDPGDRSMIVCVAPVPFPAVTSRTVTAADPVFVAPSPKHGLGVFATSDIPAGQVVHVAPVILLGAADLELIDETPLRGLVYGWTGDEPGMCAFALGLGSLFNHAAEPNCVYHRVDAGDVSIHTGATHLFDALTYTTVREVEEGEELTIDYSGGDPSVLWFDPS
jgi:SET domain-containing protein